jgi:hypothetical protein
LNTFQLAFENIFHAFMHIYTSAVSTRHFISPDVS